MKYLSTALLLLLALLVSNNLYAAKWYQIELIVFEQNSSDSEVFDYTESTIPWPSHLVELSQIKYSKQRLLQAPINFAKIAPNDRLLNDEYYLLRARSRYQPILYESWVQSVAANSKGRPVRIVKKSSQAGYFPINGYVSLERGYYLHLTVKLEFAKDNKIYTMNQRRKLRLNELNYLDHPKFGVMATVKRLN